MTDKCKTFVARWDHAMCSTCGEEHDRPAPTPTAPPALDLDAVERAERAMTPGPWRHGSVERHHVFCSEGDRSLLCPEAGRVLLRMNEHFPHDSNAAGIVALRNAAPALIAEVRRLRALVDEREGDMHARIRAGYDKTVADAWRAEVAKRDAEIADLRAKLAEAKRLAREGRRDDTISPALAAALEAL